MNKLGWPDHQLELLQAGICNLFRTMITRLLFAKDTVGYLPSTNQCWQTETGQPVDHPAKGRCTCLYPANIQHWRLHPLSSKLLQNIALKRLIAMMVGASALTLGGRQLNSDPGRVIPDFKNGMCAQHLEVRVWTNPMGWHPIGWKVEGKNSPPLPS